MHETYFLKKKNSVIVKSAADTKVKVFLVKK